MPEKTAIKTNNYGIMPVSFLLASATIVLLFLKIFKIVSISWLIVFAPVAIWIGIVLAAALALVAVLSIVAMIQIWR